MRYWLPAVAALAALGFAALHALPKVISSCEQESPLPQFGMAALFLLLWAGAGLFVTIKGEIAQRALLFVGTILILLGYGYALSKILPLALGTGACGPTG